MFPEPMALTAFLLKQTASAEQREGYEASVHLSPADVRVSHSVVSNSLRPPGL